MKVKFSVPSYFLNWWIVFNLICVGSVVAWFLKVFHMTNAADVTKISFIIYILFLVFTIRTGVFNYRFGKCKNATPEILDEFSSSQEISWFVSDVLLTLGMLGTILGYIYMIEVGFALMDPANIHSMQASLKSMAIGWGTALYTTASGLICSLLLKMQLFNTAKQLEHLSKSCIATVAENEGPSSNLPLQGLGV